MIQLNTDARLKIILPSTNRALAEALKSASPEELSALKEGKDLKSLLSSAFHDTLTSSKSNQTLLELLKNAPAFQNRGNVADTLATLLNGLRSAPDLPLKTAPLEAFLKQFQLLSGESLKTQIANSGVFMESKISQAIQTLPTLEETLQNVQLLLSRSTRPEAQGIAGAIDALLGGEILSEAETDPQKASELGSAVKTIADALRSLSAKMDALYSEIPGHADAAVSAEASALASQLDVFGDPDALLLETALEKAMEEDLKSQLLGLGEELKGSPHPKAPELLEHVDRLLTQIDYHQLLSYLGSSNTVYFPFAWEMLEEGSIGFKKTKEKKFYCEINLRLREYGELDLLMALYEGNQLEIQAHAEKEELKTLITDNIPQLRSLLIDAGLTPTRIRVTDIRGKNTQHPAPYESRTGGPDHWFEVTV